MTTFPDEEVEVVVAPHIMVPLFPDSDEPTLADFKIGTLVLILERS